MMGKKLTPAEHRQRIADAAEYEYNPEILGQLWGMSDKGAAEWMRDHCRCKYVEAKLKKEVKTYKYHGCREYENQELFDLYTLTEKEFCEKYKTGVYTYRHKLAYYEGLTGEKVITPRIRQLWTEDYERRLCERSPKEKWIMLTFILKKKWYAKIKRGEKTIEYRVVKPYWTIRIYGKDAFPHGAAPPYENLPVPRENRCVLRPGYTGKHYMTADITEVQVVDGMNTDLQVDRPVYAIHLTNIKEFKYGKKEE